MDRFDRIIELIDKLNSKDEIVNLLNNIKSEYINLKNEYSRLEIKYRNLEDEADYYDNNFFNLYQIETNELIKELEIRKFNIIASDNLYNNEKVEILKQMYEKYNLEQLQNIYERFNKK